MLFAPRVPQRDDEEERAETIPCSCPLVRLRKTSILPKEKKKTQNPLNLAQVTPLENLARSIPSGPHIAGDLPVSAFSVPDGFPRLPWKHALQQLKRPFPTCRRRKPYEHARQPSCRSRCRRPPETPIVLNTYTRTQARLRLKRKESPLKN